MQDLPPDELIRRTLAGERVPLARAISWVETEHPQASALLACKSGGGSDCLTAPQVEAARKIYSGPANPRTGQNIFPGLEPGSDGLAAGLPFGCGHGLRERQFCQPEFSGLGMIVGIEPLRHQPFRINVLNLPRREINCNV